MTDPRPLALVTGASTGIGYELARQLAALGHDLVVVADEALVHEVAQELRPQGVEAHAVQADLATPSGVAEVERSLAALERPVSVAALNAGVAAYGRFDEIPAEDDERVVMLNVVSTVRLAKDVVRQMVNQQHGRLLLTSSIAAAMPGPLMATYAASKSFVHSFAEALHEELKDTGVTVTSLLPGPTETEFFDRAGMQESRVANMSKDDPTDVAREALEALMAGKDKVVTGSAMNAASVAGARAMPDTVRAKAQRRLAEPQ